MAGVAVEVGGIRGGKAVPLVGLIIALVHQRGALQGLPGVEGIERGGDVVGAVEARVHRGRVEEGAVLGAVLVTEVDVARVGLAGRCLGISGVLERGGGASGRGEQRVAPHHSVSHGHACAVDARAGVARHGAVDHGAGEVRRRATPGEEDAAVDVVEHGTVHHHARTRQRDGPSGVGGRGALSGGVVEEAAQGHVVVRARHAVVHVQGTAPGGGVVLDEEATLYAVTAAPRVVAGDEDAAAHAARPCRARGVAPAYGEAVHHGACAVDVRAQLRVEVERQHVGGVVSALVLAPGEDKPVVVRRVIATDVARQHRAVGKAVGLAVHHGTLVRRGLVAREAAVELHAAAQGKARLRGHHVDTVRRGGGITLHPHLGACGGAPEGIGKRRGVLPRRACVGCLGVTFQRHVYPAVRRLAPCASRRSKETGKT